jgi:hypothetical protein
MQARCVCDPCQMSRDLPLFTRLRRAWWRPGRARSRTSRLTVTSRCVSLRSLTLQSRFRQLGTSVLAAWCRQQTTPERPVPLCLLVAGADPQVLTIPP